VLLGVVSQSREALRRGTREVIVKKRRERWERGEEEKRAKRRGRIHEKS